MYKLEIGMDKGIPDTIRQLAEATSGAARVMNRFWLALAVVCLMVVVPQSPNAEGKLEVPLLGVLPVDYFAGASAALLAAAVVAFCSSYAHLIRVEMLVRRMLGDPNDSPSSEVSHHHDLIDMARLPSVSRVAPLAQLLRGPWQFFSDKDECPSWLRWLTAVLYVGLKIVAGVVFLGLPALALINACERLHDTPFPTALPSWLSPALWILLGTAAFALLEVAVVEVFHVVKAFLAIGRRSRRSTGNTE